MTTPAEHAELTLSARPHAVSPGSRHTEAATSPPPGPANRAAEQAGPADSAQAAHLAEAGGERTVLAERQAALAAALVAGGPDPEGFDPDRLAAARRALVRKRAGEAAREWPALAVSFGDGWTAAFAAHHAGREPAGALRDGWDLARALRADLSVDAAAELAEREALLRYDGRSAPRRRRFGRVRLAWLRRTL